MECKKKCFAGLAVLSILLCAVSLKADTLAYWNFDEFTVGDLAADGSRVLDSSGNGRDILVSVPSGNPFDLWQGNWLYNKKSSAVNLTERATGGLVFKSGYVFGDGGAAAGTTLTTIPKTSSITFETLVRFPKSSSGRQSAFMRNAAQNLDGLGNDELWWRMNYSNIDGVMKNVQNFAIRVNGRLVWTEGVTDIVDGKWHHIAAVKESTGGDGIKILLYVDGVLEKEASGTLYDNYHTTNDLWIGSFESGTTRDMIGCMDFMRISSGALTPAQFVMARKTAAAPAPLDGSIDQDVSLVLSWTPVAATSNSQTVTISTDAGFNNIFQSFASVTGGEVSVSGLSQSATYYWKVDSDYTDPNGTFFEEGPVWQFSTVEANAAVAGFWKFDDASPGTVIVEGAKIADSSGNNRNLYVLNEEAGNDALYGNPAAAYDSVASFEGVNDCQLVLEPGYDFNDGGALSGSNIAFLGSDEFTFEAVVKINPDNTETNAIISFIPDADSIYWYTSNQSNYWFRIEPTGSLYIYFRSGSSQVTGLGSTSLINDGQWHHIAAVRDTAAGTMSLYVDYTLDASIADVVTEDVFPLGKLVVGGFNNAISRNFGGNLDFVKVSRAALAPSEFEQIAYSLPSDPTPADKATGIISNTPLSWTSAPGVGVISETVVISDDPYMGHIVETLAVSEGTATPVTLIDNVTYYWRVDTETSEGTYQGTVWSFGTLECLVKAKDGNLNDDCIVDISDFAIMASNWLKSEYAY